MSDPLPGISRLPGPLLGQIASSLPLQERAHLRLVNRNFKNVVENTCHISPVPDVKPPRSHPLLPSPNFIKFITLQERATFLFVSISFGFRHGCAWYVGNLSSSVTFLPPLEWIYWAPSILAYTILGMNQKASWAAPIGGIIIYTLAAYKSRL